MFGIAMVCAIATAALIGPSVAAAEGTYLCKANEKNCLPSNRYLPPTLFVGQVKEGSEAKLVTGAGTVSCKKSRLEGEITEEGKALEGTVAAMTLEECKLSEKTACTITAVHLPYAVEEVATSEGDGSFNPKNSGKGKPGATVSCGASISCTYLMEPKLPFKGGNPATIVAEKVGMEVEGGITCPKGETTFTATYSLTTPTGAVFLATQDRTVLCNANEAICAGPKTYAANTAIEAALTAGGNAKIELPAELTTECSVSTLKAKSTVESLQPLTIEFQLATFTTCNNTCTVEVLAMGPTAALRAQGSGKGELSILGPKLKMTCTSPSRECTFSKPTVILDLTGGTPKAKIDASAEVLNKETGGCVETLKWTGAYTVSAVSPLFVAG